MNAMFERTAGAGEVIITCAALNHLSGSSIQRPGSRIRLARRVQGQQLRTAAQDRR